MPTEPDPAMAHEQRRRTAPPPSHQLLDAVLRNLYDLGEWGPRGPTWGAGSWGRRRLPCGILASLDYANAARLLKKNKSFWCLVFL